MALPSSGNSRGKLNIQVAGVALGIVAISLLSFAYSKTSRFADSVPAVSPTAAKAPPESLSRAETIGPANPNSLLLDRETAKIYFYRDDYIYLYDASTNDVRKIVKGSDPDVSPSGTTIAFTEGKRSPNSTTTIKILDLKSNEGRGFETLDGVNSYAPRWSHDGRKLAFNLIIDRLWRVGLLDVETGHFDILSRNVGSDDFLVFDSWLDGDRSIICHDLQKIYELSRDGQLLKEILITSIIPAGDISTSTRFSFSRDRRYLLFDGHREPDNDAVYIYDFGKQALSTITSNRINASQPVWLPSEKGVMFSRLQENKDDRAIWDICITRLDGTDPETLMQNASHASYTTK